MLNMTFRAGTCYRNTNNPPPPQHYWFVLSDPKLNAECVFVANVTSWNDFYGDKACRLKAGDHPRIDRDSYVNYEDAKLFRLQDMDNWCKQGLMAILESASEDLLQLMQHGAIESEFCKNKFKKLLASQHLPRIASN